jgi:NIPSNAP
MRIYQAVPENLPVFHEFFRSYLLPVQLRYGARLVGRWETDDGRVVAVWEYDDRDAYERIEAAVHADPDSARARQRRSELPPLIMGQQETFMTATVRTAPGAPNATAAVWPLR